MCENNNSGEIVLPTVQEINHAFSDFKGIPGVRRDNQPERAESALGVERSALEGMLETLVRQGKLREVCSVKGGGCHCGSGCHGCSQYHGDGLARKSYELGFTRPAGWRAK